MTTTNWYMTNDNRNTIIRTLRGDDEASRAIRAAIHTANEDLADIEALDTFSQFVDTLPPHCNTCGRLMTKDEVGTEWAEDRTCDTCAG